MDPKSNQRVGLLGEHALSIKTLRRKPSSTQRNHLFFQEHPPFSLKIVPLRRFGLCEPYSHAFFYAYTHYFDSMRPNFSIVGGMWQGQHW